MYMILHLNDEKYLDDIIMALTEVGIDDTFVLSAESLGHKLTFENPIFAGFKDSIGSQRGYGNIIMALVEEEDVNTMLEELKNAGINFIEDEIGKITLLPVAKVI